VNLPAPPPNVDVSLNAVDPNGTTRERYQEHLANPSCSACHTLMDPSVSDSSTFDAVGRYRDTELGQPIDATGTLFSPIDTLEDFRFDGVLRSRST